MGSDSTRRQLVRPPARAGQFYPGAAPDMWRRVDECLALGKAAEREPRDVHGVHAVMLPHAGWVFCGATIGMTLARVAVPESVIVVGPRHTPYGANWSVAPEDAWAIPGGEVPVDRALADRLNELVPYMQVEPMAHRMEHGCEVLLPFLLRKNPAVKVVPVVMGSAGYAETTLLAQGLAAAVRERRAAGGEVLLVVSSDMNHFAPEAENRRLDALALDEVLQGDPHGLYEVCVQERISMCGMLPAAAVMQSIQMHGVELRPELIDYRTSAQAGVPGVDASRVVGYAGVVLA